MKCNRCIHYNVCLGYRNIDYDGDSNSCPYAEERPHGEWIKESNGKTTDLYICSVCKRSIMLCKGADLTNYPFCHCGADMRCKEEEK